MNKSTNINNLRIFTPFKNLTKVRYILYSLPKSLKGFLYAYKWRFFNKTPPALSENNDNPLRDYFNSHKEGRGIMKWDHYLDIYDHHLSKFVGQEVHILEVGIHSGGSLEMWKNYLGKKCRVYGIDIHDVCKMYEDEQTKVFIGDQGSRKFWNDIKKKVPHVDIIIDDGSHNAKDQIITLEEMLPHIRQGGVYLCEDVKGLVNGFSIYMSGLTINLNACKKREGKTHPTKFQKDIRSIHTYPFVTVIEKNHNQIDEFSSVKHGSLWQCISGKGKDRRCKHNPVCNLTI